MNQTDPRAQAAFDAALQHIKTTIAGVADRVADQLGVLAASRSNSEREVLSNAQLDLRRHKSTFVLVFGNTLSDRVSSEVRRDPEPARKAAQTDWQSLSLVDDAQVEEQMYSGRIAQAVTHECEWELREIASFTGQLMGTGRAEHERNPLRPEVLGACIYRGIAAVSTVGDIRKALARELGSAVARAMPACYTDILKDFRARGIKPVALTVKSVEGPGNELARDRVVTGYSTISRDSGLTSGSGSLGASFHQGHDPGASFGSQSGASTGTGVGAGASGRSGGGSRYGAPAAQSDAELMSLIRRLTFLATRPSDLGQPSGPGNLGPANGLRGVGAAGAMGATTVPGRYGNNLSNGLMAVNLIHAHREELRQASTGTLDHMVIEVVGSLFDQILSDPRVPPQMARQIARLQLPVLRVALNDNSFFSSRKHPVRRFVNRMSSMALAFEDFDDGPGKQFMAHVRALVQEIVEGDFDQIEVYAAKLSELEAFVASQAKADVEASAAAVSVVDNKETDLRVQQRYMMQLRGELTPIAMQDYMRDFLTQVWSQALVLATRRDGAQSDLAKRLKRAGRDLVLSVQPKGSPGMRKRFLMQLPALMKDLNEGMKLVAWPEVAQKEFLGKLLPAHAESLKGQPLTDLEYNLLAKQLEAVFNVGVPEADGLLRDSGMSVPGAPAIEPQFSEAEAKQIGLIDESAIDWSGQVDIDLSAEPEPEPVSSSPDTSPMDLKVGLASTLDINLDLSPNDPAEPSQGPQLIDHVRLGFAYQMHLSDQWQKVRLNYVSPGRAFFVFTRGKRHHETVSLTARMLSRMCETGRFKAFESAYLIERATARARKQLAALSAGSTKH